MVMAQTQPPNTNTQYVAHEFVRQYYTILHKDPTQLHRSRILRFYHKYDLLYYFHLCILTKLNFEEMFF